jgi:hypothetical protein
MGTMAKVFVVHSSPKSLSAPIMPSSLERALYSSSDSMEGERVSAGVAGEMVVFSGCFLEEEGAAAAIVGRAFFFGGPWACFSKLAFRFLVSGGVVVERGVPSLVGGGRDKAAGRRDGVWESLDNARHRVGGSMTNRSTNSEQQGRLVGGSGEAGWESDDDGQNDLMRARRGQPWSGSHGVEAAVQLIR